MLLSEAFPKLFDIVALRYELVILLTFYEQEINKVLRHKEVGVKGTYSQEQKL